MVSGRLSVGWLLMACVFVSSVNFGSCRECLDRANWCHKLGSKLPLSRCYKHENRCCQTCRRLKLPISGCPYGDKLGWCNSLGFDRPAADCYAYNETCCQTCHLYDSGIPDCPFGDRVTWCNGIGVRYSISSCYDHQYHCCQTCNQFTTAIDGCPYGDRLAWCAGIGDVYPMEHCRANGFECCETCQRLKQGEQFGQNETLGGANSSTAIGTTPERTPPSVSPAASNISSRPLIPFIVSPVTSTTMAAPHSTTTTTISTIASETRTINRTLVVGGATNHYAVEGAIPTPPVQGDVAHVIDRPFGDRVANDSSNSSTTIAPVKDKSAHYVDSSVVEREGGRNVSVTNELDHRSVSSNGTVGERRHVIVQSNSGETESTNSATRSVATSCESRRITLVMCAILWITLMNSFWRDYTSSFSSEAFKFT